MTAEWTRRSVLAGGAFVTAPAFARRSARADVRETLLFLLKVERVNEGYYAHALREIVLSPPLKTLVTELRSQERRHVAAVERALERAGGALPPRFRQRVRPTDEHRFTREAIALEDIVAGAWAGAAPGVAGSDLLDTVGSLVAAEGRHATVLRLQAGLEPAVPSARVVPLGRTAVLRVLGDLTIARAGDARR